MKEFEISQLDVAKKCVTCSNWEFNRWLQQHYGDGFGKCVCNSQPTYFSYSCELWTDIV